MRVVVTGGRGALGRSLISALSTTGTHAITSFVSPRVAVMKGGEVAVDVADATLFSRALQAARPDVVVHLAAVTGAVCDDKPDIAQAVNVGSVQTLIRVARGLGLERIVFASSSAVYGDVHAAPMDESTRLAGASRYARTKIDAEQMLLSASHVQTVSLRVFNLFGPGFANSLVNRLQASSPEHPVELRGLDSFVRDYVHIDDVVDAVDAAIVATFPHRNITLNIGTGVPTSNRQLLAQLPTAHASIVSPQSSYSCAKIDSARHLLSFHPTRRITDL